MPEITKDALYKEQAHINQEFMKLAELLQENPEAYKLCFVINGKFLSFSERALMPEWEKARPIPNLT